MQNQTFEEIYEWVNSFSRQDRIFSPTNAKFDFKITNGALVISRTLETPVMMSIFCEKKASEFEVANPLFRRGHYTTLLRADKHEVGSLLWLYTEKNTMNSEEVPIIQDDLMLSMAFLVEQEQAKDVDVVCTQSENRKLSIAVSITPEGDIQPFSETFLV